MSDGVVERSKVNQSLVRAHSAWQGSSFCMWFRADRQLEMTSEARQMRTQLLEILSQLIDTEFHRAMDELVVNWIAYREATK